MVLTRTIPCLLIDNDQLVKTIKFKNPTYVGDPINAIKIYNEKEVDELILLDITATEENRGPNYELVKNVADECFMPVCYGGGIKSVEQMKELFSLGIEKISVNSVLNNKPDIISEAAKIFGNQSIVVSLDRGKHKISGNISEFITFVEELGAGELLINSIDREGTWDGFDLE